METFHNNLFQRFVQLEDEYNVFEIIINGTPVWERLRFDLFRSIRQQQTTLDSSQPDTTTNTINYIRGTKLLLKNTIMKNPFLTKQHEYLFYGHPRRKLLEDGKWWDVYCDPIYDQTNIDYLHIEDHYQMGHKTPAKTDNLRYNDLIWFTGALKRNLGIVDVTLSVENKKRFDQISSSIEQEFGVKVDLARKVEVQLTERASTLGLYKKFLRKVDPNVAIVGFSDRNVKEACQELDIPTVRLQHGHFNEMHPRYHYPKDQTNYSLSDYFFVWGDFWANLPDFPIPQKNVIAVGYPFLEQRREKYRDVESSNQILFISSKSVGKKLSKLAVEVSQNPEINQDIIYKLHPSEYDCWQQNYPWLKKVDFEVVDGDSPSLYELFAESSVQVGVYSTALFEGLYFDLETYVYDCTGVEYVRALIDQGVAHPISSADELASSLDESMNSFDPDLFFAPNSIERITTALERISSRD